MDTLQIWNQALSKLPHDKQVVSLTEDSTEALRCATEWEGARKSVLTSHAWGCLKRTTVCTAGCNYQHEDMKYTYPRPANALRVIGLFDIEGRQVRSEVINNAFFSDAPMASIRYVVDQEDPSELPFLMQEAIMYELAARIALPITGNVMTQRMVQAQAKNALELAKQADSSETDYSGTRGTTYADARN